MTSRFQIALSNDPHKAFGKHTKVPRATENAFQTLRQDQSRFRTTEMPAFESSTKNPAFSENAMQAFGRKSATHEFGPDNAAFQPRHTQDNFDDTATHAFRKKRVEEKHTSDAKPVHSNPHSLLNIVLNALPDSTEEWKESAFRKKTNKPALKVEEEAFPQLDAFPPLGSSKSSKSVSSPSMSFANLVKKRAEDEAKEAEEKAAIEKKRMDERKKRQDELDREKASRILYNKNKFRAIQLEPEEDQELEDTMPNDELGDDCQEEEEDAQLDNAEEEPDYEDC